jgi:hypothetical protein
MSAHFTQAQIRASNTGTIQWDLDNMVSQIQQHLQKEIDPSTIRQTLLNILSKYERVPIQIYVPILACREVEQTLKKLY